MAHRDIAPNAVASTLPTSLLDDITRAGYYPQIVIDVLDIALAGEVVVAHLVQAATTFDSEVRRHLTVLLLTPTRLVTAHVDDHEGHDGEEPSAAATTEAVSLREIRSVGLTHVVANPTKYRGRDHTSGLTLAIGWGGVSRVDLEPASCGDPNCDGDHGLTGSLMPDDIVIRVAMAAEGPAAVRRAVEFAQALSAATARHP